VLWYSRWDPMSDEERHWTQRGEALSHKRVDAGARCGRAGITMLVFSSPGFRSSRINSARSQHALSMSYTFDVALIEQRSARVRRHDRCLLGAVFLHENVRAVDIERRGHRRRRAAQES